MVTYEGTVGYETTPRCSAAVFNGSSSLY